MVNSLESLLDAHLISVWVAVVIEPEFIIKTGCLHHSSVSFPMSHGIAIPRRFRISGQRSPVEVDHTVHVEVIEELDQPVFRLLSEKQTSREAGSGAADSYDLSGDINNAITIESHASLFRQRQPITLGGLRHFSQSLRAKSGLHTTYGVLKRVFDVNDFDETLHLQGSYAVLSMIDRPEMSTLLIR
jgi:hypothetical protein